ncbi:hypothetical protein [Hufsiella ginkgonis]|uniref:Uncharacterized protein n=1 Tax=Hufsiella ginkgonis TaxID=2695274 RepID=A0A7K1XYK3_9SPHI|nr:hypothetical protein [Hufsiella ginkgonis]MXV16084.1 hypothetical protein [Hufsiella ginkgonis]
MKTLSKQKLNLEVKSLFKFGKNEIQGYRSTTDPGTFTLTTISTAICDDTKLPSDTCPN